MAGELGASGGRAHFAGMLYARLAGRYRSVRISDTGEAYGVFKARLRVAAAWKEEALAKLQRYAVSPPQLEPAPAVQP